MCARADVASKTMPISANSGMTIKPVDTVGGDRLTHPCCSGEGRPAEVANDPAVVAAYLGEFPEGDESGDESIGIPEALSTGDSR